jgi:hypothetical protein
MRQAGVGDARAVQVQFPQPGQRAKVLPSIFLVSKEGKVLSRNSTSTASRTNYWRRSAWFASREYSCSSPTGWTLARTVSSSVGCQGHQGNLLRGVERQRKKHPYRQLALQMRRRFPDLGAMWHPPSRVETVIRTRNGG